MKQQAEQAALDSEVEEVIAKQKAFELVVKQEARGSVSSQISSTEKEPSTPDQARATPSRCSPMP